MFYRLLCTLVLINIPATGTRGIGLLILPSPSGPLATAVNINIKMIMIDSFICTLSLRLCLAPHGSKIAAWNIAMEQSCPSVHT